MKKRCVIYWGIAVMLDLLSGLAITGYSQGKTNQYMLAVGINNYTGTPTVNEIVTHDGRTVPNLYGCNNDIDTVEKTFKKYYHFDQRNIYTLYDQHAAKDSIRAYLKMLAAKCKPGDVMVFYYSGHGSLTYSDNTNRMLQKSYINSIVPADIRFPAVSDLTNLELNDIFQAFTSKKVKLTVITDCCNSATITRGQTMFDADTIREVKASPLPFTFNAAQLKATTPLTAMGAVTISACQDNEPAKEYWVNLRHYGAFTYCFCSAIAEWSRAPVMDLMNATIAKLKFIGKEQNPNVETADSRRMQVLTGTEKGASLKTQYRIISLNKGNDTVTIRGGFIDGLFENDLLVEHTTKDSISIFEVNGPDLSKAIILNKSHRLKGTQFASMVFNLLRPASNPDAPLKIFIGNGIDDQLTERMMRQAKELYGNNQINWMVPSRNILPEAVLYDDQVTTNTISWKLNENNIPGSRALGDKVSDGILDSLKNKRVYLQIPPFQSITTALDAVLGKVVNRNIKRVSKAADADYMLAGELDKDGNTLQYGWISTRLRSEKENELPVTTDFFTWNGNSDSICSSLADRIFKLSVLDNWLTLSSPPGNNQHYPFTLQIKDTLTGSMGMPGKMLQTGMTDKEYLRVSFINDAGRKEAWDNNTQFIYVFSIDPKGNMVLIFPNAGTGIFDYPRGNGNPYLASVQHTSPGKYHYFLLTSKDRIINTSVFNQQGVTTRSEIVPANAFEKLVLDQGREQRGEIKMPGDWMIRKVEVYTTDKPVKNN